MTGTPLTHDSILRGLEVGTMNTKLKVIGYWLTTGLFAAASWSLRPPSRTWRADAPLPKSAQPVASPEGVAVHV